jgi:alanine dehydrogenase
MKIGIIKEGKTPADRRVPLSPHQCRELFDHYPQMKVIVQPSPKRCFMDEEYEDAGILLDDNLKDCELLLGIKEVRTKDLIPGKTYMFFSHTAKKQSYNKELLKEVLDKKITLIDYEYLTDKDGLRLIGFGQLAGIIGAYNGFRALALKNKMKEPKPAHTCDSFKDFINQAKTIQVPPVKILITGNGSVSNGAIKLLNEMGITQVSIDEYLQNEKFEKPVFVQVDVDLYNKRKDGKPFEMSHFSQNPEEYEPDFYRFAKTTDCLIMAAYWDSKAPRLLTSEEMKREDFRINVIADITCDIKGAIPSTIRTSTIEDPFYGYNPKSETEELAFVSPANVCIMAVDNLPNELPQSASEQFGRTLIEKILPQFLSNDDEGILFRATIAKDGKLTDKFSYLQEWIDS